MPDIRRLREEIQTSDTDKGDGERRRSFFNEVMECNILIVIQLSLPSSWLSR